MRFVFCLVIAGLLLPAFGSGTNAAEAVSLSRAQAAAAKGDQNAARAVATTTDHDTCMNGCASRGYSKNQCVTACRPGLCHPDAEQPYCVSK
jgi:hypothetical protein